MFLNLFLYEVRKKLNQHERLKWCEKMSLFIRPTVEFFLCPFVLLVLMNHLPLQITLFQQSKKSKYFKLSFRLPLKVYNCISLLPARNSYLNCFWILFGIRSFIMLYEYILFMTIWFIFLKRPRDTTSWASIPK